MKSTYVKYIFSSLRKDFSRIAAIIGIVVLASGFLVGLLSTTPDLFQTMDNYYDETSFMDIQLRSTIGFDEETLTYIEDNISDIQNIDMTSDDETYITIDGTRAYASISYRSFNSDSNNYLTLVEGRYPTSSDEVVLLEYNSSLAEYQIGSTITYNDETFTVVGSVRNPMYITYQSETSYTTGATIEAYVYLDSSYYEDLTFTTVYITFNKAVSMNAFEDEYEAYIEEKIADLQEISADALQVTIDNIKDTIYDEVYDSVYDAALQEAADAISEILGREISKELVEQFLDLPLFTSIKDQFEQTIATTANELIDEQIANYNPTWYILDRDSISSAYQFKTDALKVQTISYIFPPFFLLIAVLVCLSSMSRIITRDRAIIGTFKALGFSKFKIASKYLLYGLVSSLIGCVAGCFIGIFAIPAIIMSLYGSIYYLATLAYTFQALMVIGFTILMLVLLLAVVIGVILNNLKQPAAVLMLGNKSPKPGKKILLERIPILWKHLKFKYKSMLRNIFRFKKNLLMMIIGIGGCVGMLVAGFGLTDSFSVFQNEQFDTIIKYDALVLLSEENTDLSETFESIQTDLEYESIYYQSVTLSEDESYSLSLISSADNIDSYIGLYNEDNLIEFTSTSVVVSKQISQDFDLYAGDEITINSDFGEKTLIITDVFNNYVSNYLIIGSDIFNTVMIENTTVEADTYNAYLLNILTDDEDIKEEVIDTLINNLLVSTVSSTDALKETYNTIISNLSLVVILIIFLSGALAVIVIYNLTDININERIREMATLRVLGYRRREVLMYILREIFFMSVIGILIGLGIGVFLHWFVVVNIGSVGLLFSTAISWQSYVYSILIAMVFVTIVTMCFYPKIKKINMAESLKSVD